MMVLIKRVTISLQTTIVQEILLVILLWAVMYFW